MRPAVRRRRSVYSRYCAVRRTALATGATDCKGIPRGDLSPGDFLYCLSDQAPGSIASTWLLGRAPAL